MPFSQPADPVGIDEDDIAAVADMRRDLQPHPLFRLTRRLGLRLGFALGRDLGGRTPLGARIEPVDLDVEGLCPGRAHRGQKQGHRPVNDLGDEHVARRVKPGCAILASGQEFDAVGRNARTETDMQCRQHQPTQLGHPFGIGRSDRECVQTLWQGQRLDRGGELVPALRRRVGAPDGRGVVSFIDRTLLGGSPLAQARPTKDNVSEKTMYLKQPT